MKYNKGFMGIGVIISIIVALVVGGSVVYYYAKKTKAPNQENVGVDNYQPVEQNYNPLITNNNPSQQQTPPCSPSITVLSPNGGEVYTAGQQITVKWKSCNLNQQVGVTLSGFPIPNSTQFFLGNWVSSTSGNQVVTIPSTALAGKYTINISTPPESSHSVEDWSNNYFTIK